MKVFVLHYSHWEESEIKGVYTEDAMKKELAQYAKWGREYNDRAIAEQEKRIDELKRHRKAFGQEDRKLSENQAKLKSEGVENVRKLLKSKRKEIARQMSQLARSIETQELGLQKMRNLTDEELAKREMERGHLYFEECYLLGYED